MGAASGEIQSVISEDVTIAMLDGSGLPSMQRVSLFSGMEWWNGTVEWNGMG